MPLIGYEKDTITKLLLCSFLFLGMLRQAYPNKFRSLAFIFISKYQLLKLNEVYRKKNRDKPFYFFFGLFAIALFSYLSYLTIITLKINLSTYSDELLTSILLSLILLSIFKYFWSLFFQTLFGQREEFSSYYVHKWIHIFGDSLIGLLILVIYNYSYIPKEQFLMLAFPAFISITILGQTLAFLLYLKKVGFITSAFTFLFNDLLPYAMIVITFYLLR